MTHQDQPIDQPINTALATMLQACGFEVLINTVNGEHLVHGTIESAVAFYRLTVAGTDANTAMQPMPVVEPVLWANFADNGNIRLWTTNADKAKEFDLVPLYRAAPIPAASVQPDYRDKQIEGLAADVLRLPGFICPMIASPISSGQPSEASNVRDVLRKSWGAQCETVSLGR